MVEILFALMLHDADRLTPSLRRVECLLTISLFLLIVFLTTLPRYYFLKIKLV